MYAPIDMDGDLFYLRPMACPHHIKMFMRKPVSYKEMPVRYAEIADYNRYEKSGELMGMIRLRKFQLTDAHIFVDPAELKEEFKNICSLINTAMKGLGILEKVTYRFSKHDPKNTEKYYPDPKLWETSERTMKEALDEIGLKYTEAPDEAAFYGPKLDVQIKNVNGKEDTIITAQMDFLLPEKFDIAFTDKEGKKVRPVMIHRSAIGALERTFAFLIEHYAGAFPSWLAPIQARILPVSEKHNGYAEEVLKALKAANIRAELDTSSETLGKRIRAGKTEKIPYLLVLGDKEVEAKNITVENRDGEKMGAVTVEKFTEHLTSEQPKI
jgi:threonyl-tRNA synthetase